MERRLNRILFNESAVRRIHCIFLKINKVGCAHSLQLCSSPPREAETLPSSLQPHSSTRRGTLPSAAEGMPYDIHSHKLKQAKCPLKVKYINKTVVYLYNRIQQWKWTIIVHINMHELKKYVEFLIFLAMPCTLRDLSSPTRDQTRAPCSGSAES